MINIFRPKAINVIKSVIVGCRSAVTATRLASLNIKIGLGDQRIELDGWNAADLIAAWIAYDSPRFSVITPSLYESDDWFEAVLLTHSNSNEDFIVNFLVDDAEELVVSAQHRVVTTGKNGEISFSWVLPIGSRSIGPISLPDASLQTTLQTAINGLSGISTGDIVVAVSTSSTGYTITFTYGGQFEGLSIPTVTVDSSDLLKPADEATIIRTQDGSPGADEKFKLEFAVLPEYEVLDEIQEIYPGSPAPSTGTFVIQEIPGFTAGDTDPIDWDASKTEISDALTAAGLTDFTTSGGPLGTAPIRITATGVNLPTITLDNSGLAIGGASPTITITEETKGSGASGGVNAKHTFSIDSTVTGGTFTLTYPEGTTATIAFDTTGANLDAKIESKTGAGTITATGNFPSDIVVEYTGSKAAQPVALPTIDNSALDTGADITDVAFVTEGVNGTDSEWRMQMGATGESPNSGLNTVVTVLSGSEGGWFRLNVIYRTGSPVSSGIAVTEPIYYGESAVSMLNKIRDAQAGRTSYSVFLELRGSGPETYNNFRTVFSDIASSTRTLINGAGIAVGVNTPLPFAEDQLPFSFEVHSQSGMNVNVSNAIIATTAFSFPKAVTLNINGTEIVVTGTGTGTVYWGEGPLDYYSCTDMIKDSDLQDAIEAEFGVGSVTVTQSWVKKTTLVNAVYLFLFSGDLGHNEISSFSVTLDDYYTTIPSSNQISLRKLLAGNTGATGATIQVSYTSVPSNGTLTVPNTLNGGNTVVAYDAGMVLGSGNVGLRNALARAHGLTPYDLISTTGTTMVAGPVTYTLPDYLGAVELPTVDWNGVGSVHVASTVTGVTPGSTTNEVQKITIANAVGGTYKLSHSSATTAAIPYPASASKVQTELNALSIGTFTVTGVVGGPHYVTFGGSKAATNVDMMTYTNDLTGSSSPREYKVRTITQGGQGQIIAGLLNGTFDLKLTKGSEEFLVLGLAYNITNAALKTAIEDVVGATVTVTGGQLPDDYVVVELTGDLGGTDWTIEVIPHINLVEGPTLSLEKIREARLGVAENIWDLVIVPGPGTPGIKLDPTTIDDVFSIWLKIVTPEGTTSDMLEPVEPQVDLDDDGELDEGLPKIRKPSMVRVDWMRLTPELLEQAINEAFGKPVCRVVQPVQSTEHADFIADVPTASGFGPSPTRILCWYNRAVYRIIFINDFAAADSITSIEVEVPEREEAVALSNPTDAALRMDPRDFFQLPDSGANSLGSTVFENQGSDIYDGASEAGRIAGAFYMAFLAGQPLHRFEIHRVDNHPNHLSWFFKLCEHTNYGRDQVIGVRYGIADLIQDMRVQFHWANRRIDEAGRLTYEIIGSSRLIDFDATALEIQEAVGTILPTWPGTDNVRVTGSLYESWLPDEYDPRFNINGDFNFLRIEFIGDLKYLPYDRYELDLIMTIENRSLWGARASAAPWMMYSWNSTQQKDIGANTNQYIPMTHYEGRYSVPLDPLQPERYRLTYLGSGSTTLSIDGVEVAITSTETKDTLATKLNNKFGTYPKLREAAFTTYEWDSQTSDWKATTGYKVANWNPTRFASSVFTSGRSFTHGPIEIELCGAGMQYQEHVVSTGIAEYETDPIVITTQTEGSPSRHCIQVLSYPTVASSGTVTVAGEVLNVPFDAEDLEAIIDAEVSGATVVETTDNVFTITFTDNNSHALVAVSSTLYQPGQHTLSVTQSGGIYGTLVIEDLVMGGGTHWFNSPSNWSLDRNPSSGDTLRFDTAVGDVLYGIMQWSQFKPCSATRCIYKDRQNHFRNGTKVRVIHASFDAEELYYIVGALPDGTFELSETEGGAAISIASLDEGELGLVLEITTYSGYEKSIGLPFYNSQIPEYRPRYLTAWLSIIDVGIGSVGNGLNLGNFNSLDEPCDIQIRRANNGGAPPSVQLLIDSNLTNLTVDDAAVGIAYEADEEALLNKIAGSKASDIYVGVGVVYTSLNTNGHVIHYPGDAKIN